MLIGYARVSDTSQNHDLQLDALRQAGCDKLYVETASGMRTDRPELAKLLDAARPGHQICVWRLDRLARSLKHLIDLSERLQRRGVGLRSLTESIDTATPGGRCMFSILGALNQMEVEILRERTRAGLAAAAARGRKGGRPAALDEGKLRAARALLASGAFTAAEVARQVGCSTSALYRHLPGGRSSVAA
jgi:DNA invertase Pin-like site-specific DNA recombinase